MNQDLVKSYYQSYFRRMVLLGNEYVRDMDVAQDLVQDVFVALMKKETEEIRNPEAYFFTAVRQKCLDYLKTKTIHLRHHDQILHLSSDEFYEQTLENVELEAYLMKLIDDLPEQNRKIFKMSRFEAQSNEEIAKLLNVSKRTVETHISKALKKLRAGIDLYKKALFFFF